MRAFLSSVTTTSSRPSPTPRRPIFQAEPTRLAKSSIGSTPVLATITSATCAPLSDSKRASLASSAARSAALSTPGRSTTRASGGTSSSPSGPTGAASFAKASEALVACAKATAPKAAGAAAKASEALAKEAGTSASKGASTISARSSQRRIDTFSETGPGPLLAKIDFWRLLDGRLVFDCKLRLFLVAQHLRRQVLRQLADVDVVVLHRLDIAVAGDRYPVLRALELRPQFLEALIALQVRIVLARHQQSRQRRGELTLRLLELLQRRLVVDELRGDLNRRCLGTRFDYPGQGFLLEVGLPLHRVDQVRNQVGPPLVLRQHLGPGRLDRLVPGLNLVVTATGHHKSRRGRQAQAPTTHRNPPVWIVRKTQGGLYGASRQLRNPFGGENGRKSRSPRSQYGRTAA